MTASRFFDNISDDLIYTKDSITSLISSNLVDKKILLALSFFLYIFAISQYYTPLGTGPYLLKLGISLILTIFVFATFKRIFAELILDHKYDKSIGLKLGRLTFELLLVFLFQIFISPSLIFLNILLAAFALLFVIYTKKGKVFIFQTPQQ